MTLAEDIDLLAAVRADEVGHVLHETDDRHAHLIRHVHGLRHDHGHEVLRRGDDDDTVDRKGLENGQRNIAGSWWHVDEHVVDVLPLNLRPELLHGLRDEGTTPDDRVGLVLEQEVRGHDFDAAGTSVRDHELAIRGNANAVVRQTEGLRDGRAGDIRIEDRGLETGLVGTTGEERGDGGLTDTALAGNDADDLLYAAAVCKLRTEILRICVAGSTVGTAGTAVAAAAGRTLIF